MFITFETLRRESNMILDSPTQLVASIAIFVDGYLLVVTINVVNYCLHCK